MSTAPDLGPHIQISAMFETSSARTMNAQLRCIIFKAMTEAKGNEKAILSSPDRPARKLN